MRFTASNRTVAIVAIGLIAALSAAALAQRAATPPATPTGNTADVTARVVSAARALLASLDDAGRAKVQFPFDGPQKTQWSNLPTGIFQRTGLRLGDLTPAQRTTVMTLISAALSQDGFRKVRNIMRGDEVLRTTDGGRAAPGGRGGRGRGGPGGGGGLTFGEDEYFVAFVGEPSVTTPWMLQFGGHHLAVNLTMAGSQASLTPSLPAAQPASYTIEGQTIRPLGDENDKAFALINALDAAQQRQAILNFRVTDLVLGPGQDGKVIQPEGIPASALSAPQQAMLLDIAREWAGIMSEPFAERRMAELRTNLPQTYFAWSGPTTNGSAAYFRIQGPTVVIEYTPQGSVDHIHTIYRDPTNDYGARFAGK